MGAPDPTQNPRLRLAIQEAHANNMPKDNIDRAIKKSQGGDADTFEEIRYEGFGPGGIGIIVEALTDNRNRTAGEVRASFTKHGGQLGETGSVSFMFDRVGNIQYSPETTDADGMLEAAIDAGADDCASAEDGHELICAPGDMHDVVAALTERLGEPTSAKLVWKPQNAIEVSGDAAATLVKLLETLDDNNNVQNIYANFDISESEMEKLTA